MSVTELDTESEEFWNQVAYLKGSAKGPILKAINNGQSISTEIHDWMKENTDCDVKRETVSVYMGRMESDDLVECKTPSLSKNKIYDLTDKGAQLVEYV